MTFLLSLEPSTSNLRRFCDGNIWSHISDVGVMKSLSKSAKVREKEPNRRIFHINFLICFHVSLFDEVKRMCLAI